MGLGTWIAVAGLVLALLGTIATSMAVLIRTTWQLSAVLTEFKILQKKAEEREKRQDETERLCAEIGPLKEGYSHLRAELQKSNSDITELRVVTGIAARASGGEFG